MSQSLCLAFDPPRCTFLSEVFETVAVQETAKEVTVGQQFPSCNISGTKLCRMSNVEIEVMV